MLVISQYFSGENNAGPKAKRDIETILSEEYNAATKVMPLTGKEDSNLYNKCLYRVKKGVFSFKHLKGDELIVIQFPFNNSEFFLNRAKKKIAIVHDLNGLRWQNEEIIEKEVHALNLFSSIVVHNSIMKEYLIGRGVDEKRIRILECFDYLCDGGCEHAEQIEDQDLKIVYTGNLDKSPFIKQLDPEKMRFKLFVYGPGELYTNSHIIYKGQCQADVLPSRIEGDIGLVWDGNYDESDENTGFKNYTRYNNPHKLSCYIAAGIPVIVWEKAATAHFVKKYNIGYTVRNLYDINSLSMHDYNDKLFNAKELGKKVRSGYFTRKVFNDIGDIIKEKD